MSAWSASALLLAATAGPALGAPAVQNVTWANRVTWGIAAEANVRCSGCTYSDLIAKVRKAIDGAVAVRMAAADGQISRLVPRSAVTPNEYSPKR